ncbi:hypothetical protein DAPPUDRAFT_258608 [Daphnia pulex]|uniref:Uncharacterized protein n=1 Tax=Daphnia pulex TaxID=6669 RepID=E9HFP6_DAPPU|nr:hypothetical protein DAPPUDRAFT_258608 [Daphnia pulex]|eukprot:EFX69463.1 hypothetical protein DAPPUDRAFT_258608 [Daphnia pulex]
MILRSHWMHSWLNLYRFTPGFYRTVDEHHNLHLIVSVAEALVLSNRNPTYTFVLLKQFSLVLSNSDAAAAYAEGSGTSNPAVNSRKGASKKDAAVAAVPGTANIAIGRRWPCAIKGFIDSKSSILKFSASKTTTDAESLELASSLAKARPSENKTLLETTPTTTVPFSSGQAPVSTTATKPHSLLPHTEFVEDEFYNFEFVKISG